MATVKHPNTALQPASPAEHTPIIVTRPPLLVASLSALIIGPACHLAACLLLNVVVFLIAFVALLGAAFYVAFGTLLSTFAGLMQFYRDFYLCHPALCLVILPALSMGVASHGGTLRTLRFVSYLGGAIAGALIVRLAGANTFIGWLAALDGICAAYVFEKAPAVVEALRHPPIDQS